MHLNALEAENTCLLVLEVLVDAIGAVTVDIRLLHQREVDAMVELTEGTNIVVRSRLLPAELEKNAASTMVWRRIGNKADTHLVARETEKDKVFVLILVPESL